MKLACRDHKEGNIGNSGGERSRVGERDRTVGDEREHNRNEGDDCGHDRNTGDNQRGSS